MHFLLTNDDGIHAPGLAALAAAVNLLPHARWTILAPATEQSQCGHRLTTHAPLQLRRLGGHQFSLDGSPADCTRVALHHLALKPDVVLSGINAGGNMGQDLPVSGTVAAVREAAYHGIPGIAISHYLVSGLTLDWPRAAKWVAEILSLLLHQPPPPGHYFNVNLPHLPAGDLPLPGMVRTQPALSPLPVAYQSLPSADDADVMTLRYSARYADRARDPGSDVEACFSGHVSLSTLSIH